MAEIGQCLTTLKDPDLNVRRVALVDFNSAAHNKPSLIRVLLRDVLALQRDTEEEVGMGPFKHEVDDGVWLGWKYSSS